MESLSKTYRRIRYGPPIVVVSGLPRSGTSMAMQMLQAGGLSLVTDGVREPSEDNPNGFYELERVKELKSEAGKSWLDVAQGKGIKIVSYLLKDLPATRNYKVLFMRRNLDEVLVSQSKMMERNSVERDVADEKMREVFENHLSTVDFFLRRRPHFESLELNYEDVIEDPLAEAERMRQFLGRPLDVTEMARIVDAQLYRNRNNP